VTGKERFFAILGYWADQICDPDATDLNAPVVQEGLQPVPQWL
jgi:hypothetical protein